MTSLWKWDCKGDGVIYGKPNHQADNCGCYCTNRLGVRAVLSKQVNNNYCISQIV